MGRNGADASPEASPPPLPPRKPSRSQTPHETLASPHSPSADRATTPLKRPTLQSKATTAVSRAGIQSPTAAEPASPSVDKQKPVASRAPSVYGITNTTVAASRLPSSSFSGGMYSDTASIRSLRSYAPTVKTSRDAQSLLGDALGFGGQPMLEDGDNPWVSDETLEDAVYQEEVQLASLYEHEFDELEELEPDGSNEEALMLKWKLKLKHFMIFSSAGKPIFSRHGDDQVVSNTVGVIQTIVSAFNGQGDVLKTFDAGDTRFVVLSKGHLHLVAISRLQESESHLRAQLDALYMQILSTLTLPTMEKILLNRPSSNLRHPLEGTESLLAALADGFTRGSPTTLLSALECLRLRKTEREAINRTLQRCRSPNLLYGLIVAGGRLVSVLRPKKHSLHPSDLLIIFNMLFETDRVHSGGGESWIHLCLPGFNNTGYVYMYVSFLDEAGARRQQAGQRQQAEEQQQQSATARDKEERTAIILISTRPESFEELHQMRDDLTYQLSVSGGLKAIRMAVRQGRPSASDILLSSPHRAKEARGSPTVLRHFLYKSRTNVQFVMPSAEPHFSSPLAWRKLMSLYAVLHGAMHAKGASSLKMHHSVGRNYSALAWVTPTFELYGVASPNVPRTALITSVTNLVKYVQREEERLFILGGAVF